MYKNQLQELAQRSCFNLPSYSCIREGPDHAPRFKSTVNFNGETFESPSFCSTLRQAEHTAAEVALNTLANRGPSRALAAKVLDETGVYKNLLQETAHRAGLNLPVYTTVRSGPGHVPVFSCTVELAGMSFLGEPAKTKKQAQKNAAMAAWSALKQLAQRGSSSPSSTSSISTEPEVGEEQEQVVIARVLSNLRPPESSKSTQNDGEESHRRSIPMRDSILVTPNLYPMQYETWAYPNLPTELALYQMWQHAHLSQLQSRLPTPHYGPHVLPRMRSVFHPDPHLHFTQIEKQPVIVRPVVPNPDLSPSIYMSSHSIPGPISGRSMVTIQELHEERSEELLPIMSPAKSISSAGEHKPEPIFQERVKEEAEQKKCGLKTKTEGSVSEFQPIDYRLQNPHGFDSPQPNVRLNHPARVSSIGTHKSQFAAAPVMIRTVGPASSVGPRSQNSGYRIPAPSRMRTGIHSRPIGARMEFGSGVPRFVAPAVQIRSVVPVCSAPPARNMSSSNQTGESSGKEMKNENPGKEDVSEASSELSKLQM